MKPGGHLQTALWLFTVHSAVELQGLSAAQGLTQALFLQAWVKGHSSSEEQPTSRGAAENEKERTQSVSNLCFSYLAQLTNFVTSDNSISCVAFKANTAHGSSGSCRMNLASSICHTRCYGCARIHTTVSTSFLVANLKCRAVNINFTILFLYHWFRNWLKEKRKRKS